MTPAPRPEPWKIGALCVGGLAFMIGVMAAWSPDLVRDAWLGHNDFVPSYIAARLASSAQLYSPEATLRLQNELLGIRADWMLYMRPPFFAALMKPLAALPFQTAYWIFQTLSVTSIAVFVWLFARKSIEVAVLASISVPILLAVLQGQDIGFVMLAFAGFYLLSENGRGFEGGLALSLCLIKFHLFPLTGLALLLRREWAVVRGFSIGAAVLASLSFSVVGANWPALYWAALKNPALHPGEKVMPNLHGLSALMGWGLMTETLLMAAVTGVFLVVVARGCPRPLTFALALAGGLLLSYHAYAQDGMLLLAALGILGQTERTTAFRRLLQVSLTPVPYALLPPQNVWSAALTALIIAGFLAGVAASDRTPASTSVDEYR